MTQITKKKTVKDLNVDVVNLAMKVKELKDLIKGRNHLCEVKNLDEKVKVLEVSLENNAKLNLLSRKLTITTEI